MGLHMMSFNLAFRLAGPWAGVLMLERFGPTFLWPGMFVGALVSSFVLARLRNPQRKCDLL